MTRFWILGRARLLPSRVLVPEIRLSGSFALPSAGCQAVYRFTILKAHSAPQPPNMAKWMYNMASDSR